MKSGAEILCGLVAAAALLGCSSNPPAPTENSSPNKRYLVLQLYHSDADGATSSIDRFEEMDEQLIETKVRALDWTGADSGDSIVFQGSGEWLGVARQPNGADHPGAIFAEWTVNDVDRIGVVGHNLRSPPLTLDQAIDVMLAFYKQDDGLIRDLVEWQTDAQQ